ncbi:MAG TPA: SpoIIE family protein phosphatase [Tepidisphaeraceae bacterium]|nr:SpoIIE family protein phosphatase [Tepidisphaeraceae bacterium]
MPLSNPDNLKLTDFMDLPTLQEIQDSFAAVANVTAKITDAEGALLTQPTPTRDFLRRQRAIAAAEEPATDGPEGPQREGAEYIAPIMVNNQRLGTIRMSALGGSCTLDEGKVSLLAEKTGLDAKQIKSLSQQILRSRSNRPAAIQFLFLLANAIARLCFQEHQLRQRINELTAVYNVATMLAEARDLNKVLQRTVEVVCDVMKAKASSIRLIDPEHDELVIRAVHNLSPEYLSKGPIRLSTAEIDREALSPTGYGYVQNMTTDPRVQYPQQSLREGIVSMLSAGMRYKGRHIGVLRVYTSEEKHFSQLEIELLKAVAAQAAAAIENARLLAEALEAEALERQVAMAVDVQQRMVPQKSPNVPGIDLACVYVPCFELGGDLYDFMPLPADNLGLVVADVSGKGVPASLIMASVRASLRAHVDNLYYLYEVMRRVNVMLCRDTKPGEFVTLFYGVLDTNSRRLTYCNAGHPAPLLLRDGKIIELTSNNLVLGIDPQERYEQAIQDLKKNDVLLMYTDGLTDAMNFQRKTYGKQRLIESLAKGGATAEIISQNILWDMRRYVGLTERTDDVTMIVARVL